METTGPEDNSQQIAAKKRPPGAQLWRVPFRNAWRRRRIPGGPRGHQGAAPGGVGGVRVVGLTGTLIVRQAPAPKAPAIPSSLSLAPCPALPLPSDSSRWVREHVSGTRRGPKGGLRSGGRENAALGTRTRGPGTGTSSAARGPREALGASAGRVLPRPQRVRRPSSPAALQPGSLRPFSSCCLSSESAEAPGRSRASPASWSIWAPRALVVQ